MPLIIPIGLCGLNINIKVTPKWYYAPECLQENKIALWTIVKIITKQYSRLDHHIICGTMK